ncbi:MAG: NAD(P)H-dependent glycerol-3-phosphate dehydrogenase [Nitrospinaceae bacterium]
MSPTPSIAVVGAGSWGTALALLLSQEERPVDLWVHDPELCDIMQRTRENAYFLPDFYLPDCVRPSTDLAQVMADKDTLLLVTPSHVVRSMARQIKPHLSPSCLLISASKGLENESLLTVSGVLREELGDGNPLAALSGPTFAAEVARQAPSAIVAASPDAATAKRVQDLFTTPKFRVFSSSDLLGVELGGALKNVIAITAGISDGLNLGYNARAGLITRGLVEITRIGTAMGARPETFAGLSGLGDLVLTCTGDLSRNRKVGLHLAQGLTLEEITDNMKMVAEGILTVKSAHRLKQKLGIQASLIEETYRILYERKSPVQALEDLMRIEINQEFSGVQGLP